MSAKLAASSALLALACLPLVSHAQAVDAPASAATAASDSSDSSATEASVSTSSAVALPQTVVTADRTTQVLKDAIPQTTVFTSKDIQNSAATDLPGLLSLAPGVQMVTTGGLGSAASLYLRGASSQQSLILIDGVRVDSVSLGSAQLEQIPLSQIDHIEIVNGNVSALYGSGAIGGVVQIFTKDGGDHPPKFSASVSYGSYHTQTQTVGVNGALDADGKTTISASLSREKSDSFSSINTAQAPGANPNANGYLNESASASIKHKFSADWDAGISFLQSNGYKSYDNAYGASTTDLNEQISKVQQASIFANGKLTDWWTTHFNASLGDDRSNTKLNGVYEDTYRFDTDNRQYTWQNDFTVAPGQKLMAGYEHLDQSFSSNMYSAQTRHVDSGFAGYTGKLGRNDFQFNVRHDQYSDFGGANSYYLGYGFNITNALKLVASYSDAFRAPTFNDLYYPYFGNANIQPERSHSVEAGIQYATDSFGVLRLTAFETRYSNLIQYVSDGAGNYTAENVGRAKVQGIEGAWRGQIEKVDVRASFTFQNPVNQDAGTDLSLRARHFASFSASRAFDKVRVGGEWILSGSRLDGTTPLGGYGLVNLSARYNITKSWYVALQVQNLLNKDYEVNYTYNTPRRSAFVTLGWQQF